MFGPSISAIRCTLVPVRGNWNSCETSCATACPPLCLAAPRCRPPPRSGPAGRGPGSRCAGAGADYCGDELESGRHCCSHAGSAVAWVAGQLLPPAVETSYLRRSCPAGASPALLLVAAADPTGDPVLVWRAAGRWGSRRCAASAAASGLASSRPSVHGQPLNRTEPSGAGARPQRRCVDRGREDPSSPPPAWTHRRRSGSPDRTWPAIRSVGTLGTSSSALTWSKPWWRAESTPSQTGRSGISRWADAAAA